MKFGITQPFPCSYLPEKEEQLLVLVDEDSEIKQKYEILLHSGFRRSGEQIYRPHCQGCQACQSIRIAVNDFTPSRSQKRILSKNKDIKVIVSRQPKESYYPLYEHYIRERHADGSMFPPSKSQYQNFIHVSWLNSLFLEYWLEDELVAVAVSDELDYALSALYTFFAPEMEHRSLGTFAILTQIEQARVLNKQYLYLGYQVDECDKMNYKQKFLPHERFFDNRWHRIAKKSS